MRAICRNVFIALLPEGCSMPFARKLFNALCRKVFQQILFDSPCQGLCDSPKIIFLTQFGHETDVERSKIAENLHAQIFLSSAMDGKVKLYIFFNFRIFLIFYDFFAGLVPFKPAFIALRRRPKMWPKTPRNYGTRPCVTWVSTCTCTPKHTQRG